MLKNLQYNFSSVIFIYLTTVGFTNLLKVTECTEAKKIICYAATYATNRPGRGAFYLKHLNPELCTHVIFGYAHLGASGNVYVLNNWNEFMNGTESMKELKGRYPEVKFMVALGGWNDGALIFSKIAVKSESRRFLVSNTIEFLKKYDFDGLDLCWLYPSKRGGGPQDRLGFVELLKEFKLQFASYNYTLSVLISASYDTIDTGYNVKEITKIVDFMNMNTYDFNGFWSDDIQPNAPLNGSDRWNVIYAISYMIKLGANPEKLILGIPLYGRTFIASNLMNLTSNLKLGDIFNETQEARNTFLGPYTQDDSGVISYGEICLELLNRKKWTRFWDENSKTPFITHENKLITYDDPESISFKVKYVFEENLGGVAASSLDLDDFLGDCSKDYHLLRSIGVEMNRQMREFKRRENALIRNEISGIYCNSNELFEKLLVVLGVVFAYTII